MQVRFEPAAIGDPEGLAAFLAADTWPFHGSYQVSRARALELIAKGEFLAEESREFWMLVGDERVGLLRLTDYTDPTPMLDLRIRSAFRGRGLGAAGLRWITGHAFETRPDVHRIEGNTREDNVAMRRTFLKCGYVKESHYRKCWPSPEGVYYDGIGYAILRQDWLSGTTTPVRWGD
ncbi:MAG: GNAT family N-acetyltransferase [Candidatus Sericytochromatia bacterium]|nr:GNAT family N-acetyltransferase [Candidatus Tanganyikabacteria bacterium]